MEINNFYIDHLLQLDTQSLELQVQGHENILTHNHSQWACFFLTNTALYFESRININALLQTVFWRFCSLC